MNILYTCDNNYVWLMGISMISLFKTNDKAEEIHVYLIGENISKENKRILKKISKDYNRQCTIIDLPDLEIPQTCMGRWPKSAFTRLFSGQILPKSIKKVLYLDCDTIVKKNLSKLYEDKKLNKYSIYGVKDCISAGYRENLGLTENSVYINAGVLLLNLELLRKKDVPQAINDVIEKYENAINYADQDILNCMFAEDIGVMNPKYDVMTLEFACSYKNIIRLRRPSNYYSEKEINNARKNPYIIHYTTNMTVIRPWFSNSNHPKKDEFLEIYLGQKYFKNDLQEFTSKNIKYKFFDFMLGLPKCIGYPCLGFIHSHVVPFVKKCKKSINK